MNSQAGKRFLLPEVDDVEPIECNQEELRLKNVSMSLPSDLAIQPKHSLASQAKVQDGAIQKFNSTQRAAPDELSKQS